MGYAEDDIFIVCDCGDHDHLIHFYYFRDMDAYDNHMFITFYAPKGSIFNRLIFAFKYVFGISSEYGHWLEIILSPKQAKRLTEFFRNYIRIEYLARYTARIKEYADEYEGDVDTPYDPDDDPFDESFEEAMKIQDSLD